MRIAFVGNFGCDFSTESHHAWTWEHMGHEVIRLQENKTNSQEVLTACKKADAFQWTHTHGWSFPGENEITPASIKVPSFSYHLDKYFGIGSRENSYLDHPSFHLDYFFSTDGGNDERWKDASINHHWILPGVVEYGAYSAGALPVDFIPVLFCGSAGYHGEYPWRGQMVQELQRNYGTKFQVRTGIREAPLNALYSAAKVVVGDHIFAGCPRYCSDRLFETLGRAGFLIYPETEGITDQIPGLVTYHPQDIQDLFNKIDYFLDTAHEQERLERQKTSHEWVKKNGTYTQRLGEILKVMNLA